MENIKKNKGILEFDEKAYGVSYKRNDVIFFVLGIVIFLLFLFVIRIPGLDVKADYAAGILALITLWYISGCIDSGIVSIVIFVLTYLCGVMTMPELLSQIGSSAVPMLVPMLVISYSITQTNVGQRITFFAVKKFGKNPTGVVLAFLVAATVLSAVIVNWPVIIITVPIATNVLKVLGEEPGKRSKLGGAVMAAILMGSAFGGASLVCGSGINPAVINIVETASNGEITINFLQWAMIGIPFAVIGIPVCWFVLCKVAGVDRNYPIKPLDEEYINKQIADLGPISSSEKRFIITVGLMLVGFLTTPFTGIHMYIVCMCGAIASCFPGWGFISAKGAYKNIDWEIILVTIAVQLQGVIAINTGLGAWLVSLLLGWASNLPMLLFALVGIFAFAIIAFATTSIPYGIVIPGLIALCAVTGKNPLAPVLACTLVTGYGIQIPWYSGTRLTAGPNYWTTADFLKIGWLVLIPFGLVLAGVCTVLAPIVF